jgi:murein DD-endopeptidase MepM/ murein hydrolase activator NlpD
MKSTRVPSLLFVFVIALLASSFCATSFVQAQENSTTTISIAPASVIQGEPIMITLPGISLSQIASASIQNNPRKNATTSLYFTIFKSQPTSVYGVDINAATGTRTISVNLKNGSTLSGTFVTLDRKKYEATLPVPEKLGGNSATNTLRVVSILAKENTSIATIVAKKDKAYWTSTFAYPLRGQILVTDPYGYIRDTGEGSAGSQSAATITHKGTDFHAVLGTPVYAINDGTVRLAKTYTVYGKTIIVDHGLGIESLYMHLSKIVVAPGKKVKKGNLLGYSGSTGYAEAAHLHLSIKIGGTSIDPMKFFDLFNPQQI